MTVYPFDHDGKPVARDCPDPNCGGTLQDQGDGIWTCDGLTFGRDDGPLIACEHQHQDGEPVEALKEAAWADGQKAWDIVRREFLPIGASLACNLQ